MLTLSKNFGIIYIEVEGTKKNKERVCTRRAHKVTHMNNINFRTENGGVSNKVRNAVKTQASVAVGHVLDMGGIKFAYVAEKGAFVAQIATDTKTGEPVYAVLDLTITDLHPADRKARASRAGKSKPAKTEQVPELFQ